VGNAHGKRVSPMTALQTSPYTVSEWLDAVARAVTPEGDRTEVVRVQLCELIQVLVSGVQHTGEGRYRACAKWAGDGIVWVEDLPTERNACIEKRYALYRMTEQPSVIQVRSGEPARERFTIFVCATDKQIAEARTKMLEIRQAHAADADLGPLYEQIVQKMLLRDDHCARFHGRGGICNAGPDGPRIHRAYAMDVEYAAIDGGVDEAGLCKMPRPVAQAIRHLAYMPEEDRKYFLTECEEAAAARRQDAKRTFAQGVEQELKARGFHPKTARAIIKAAGPGRAIRAAEWVCLLGTPVKGNLDALVVLLHNLGGPKNFGWKRKERVLQSLGLPVPCVSNSREFDKIVAGAYAAALAGPLPAPRLSSGLLNGNDRTSD